MRDDKNSTYRFIIDLLKSIIHAQHATTKAMLLNFVQKQVKENQNVIINASIEEAKQFVQLAEAAGLLYVYRPSTGLFELVIVASTLPPQSTVVYTPEPKSEVLIDELLANLKGRLL